MESPQSHRTVQTSSSVTVSQSGRRSFPSVRSVRKTRGLGAEAHGHFPFISAGPSLHSTEAIGGLEGF